MNVNMGKKQQVKNVALNVIAYAVQFFISFYVSPIVVAQAGKEAYGFLSLSYDIVSYASILVSVLNAAASRFVADAFYKNDIEKANRYFNSLFVANCALAAGLSMVAFWTIQNLERLLVIPSTLVVEVKLTFALIFVSYLVSLLGAVFTTATFVVNRTDIQGVRNIIQYIVRFALIILFFVLLPVHVYWVALATLIANCVASAMNVRLTSVLTPELRFGKRFLHKESVIVVMKAGCWVSLANLSTVLLRGLDLTVANVFLGPYDMGLLSIARTLPNYLTNIILTIAVLYTPEFVSHYSKGNLGALIKAVNRTDRTMAVLLFVPISGFIIFSYDFYKLWQNSLSHDELVVVTLLSALTGVQSYFDAITAPLTQVNMAVNKLKVPAMVSLGSGVLSLVLEIALLSFTDMGVYAIILPTTIVLAVRYLLFNPFYGGRCIKCSGWVFAPTIVKTCLSIPMLLVMMALMRQLLPIHNWGQFFVTITIVGAMGYGMMIILYARRECAEVVVKICKKLIRNRE